MITLCMFLCLWICTAKDIKPARIMTWGFLLYLLVTAIFDIKSIYLLPVLALYLGLAIYALACPWRQYYGNKARKWKKRWVQHPAELLGYRMASWLLRLMPLSVLSWMGGRILEHFGSKSARRQQIISENLAQIMPENNNPEFIRKIWNNWGRTFAEGLKYGTYRRNMGRLVTVKNWDMVKDLPQFLIAMPHLGFMALMALPFLGRGPRIGVTYKYPSNPLTNDVILESYGLGQARDLHFIPVGNAIPMVRALRNGDILNINSDQRPSGAPYLDFMGHPARTSPGIAQLARKFNLPVVVGHVRRTRGAKHEIVFDGIVNIPRDGDAAADEMRGMQMVNDVMSRAILDAPAEYLWMHDRWRP